MAKSCIVKGCIVNNFVKKTMPYCSMLLVPESESECIWLIREEPDESMRVQVSVLGQSFLIHNNRLPKSPLAVARDGVVASGEVRQGDYRTGQKAKVRRKTD